MTVVLAGCTSAATSAATTASVGTSVVTSVVASAATTAMPASTSRGSAQTDVVQSRSGDFGVVPPEAWSEVTHRAAAVPGLDLVLASSRKVAGFSTNLVIITSAGDEAAVESEIAKGREQLGTAGRAISDTAAIDVGGVPASGFQSTFEQQGVQVVARSYGLARNGKIYLLTLSSSQQDAAHAMTDLDEILASWTWT